MGCHGQLACPCPALSTGKEVASGTRNLFQPPSYFFLGKSIETRPNTVGTISRVSTLCLASSLWHICSEVGTQTSAGWRQDNIRGATRVKQQGRVDIFQEFVAQYAREEMLAFFEFTMDLEASGSAPGLCRISQPKQGSSRLRYLSLTFVVDTPNEAARVVIQHALAHLTEATLQAALPQAAGVVPTPSMHTGPEHYIKQIDILLGTGAIPDKRFIAESLLPALQQIFPLKISEVSWWDVGSADPHDLYSKPLAAAEEGSSLVDSLKNFFRKLAKT